MAKRQEKKSESIEIRLPYSQKTAFIEACREQGLSASEALRNQIDFFMNQNKKPRRLSLIGAPLNMLERHKKKTFTAVAGTATVMSLAFAMPSAADNSVFKSFDRDGNGVLTAGEISANDSAVFSILDKDKSGKITPDEFKQNAEVIDVRDSMVPSEEKGKPDVRVIEIERTSIKADGPDDVSIWVQKWAEEVDPNISEAERKNVIERMKLQLKEVQTVEGLDKLDAVERAKVMKELKHVERLHTLAKLKELKKLENLNIDIDELAKLDSMDFDYEFDFDDLPDFSNLEKSLDALEKNESLKLSADDRRSIAEARAEIAKARAELAQLNGMKKIVVVRHEISDETTTKDSKTVFEQKVTTDTKD